MKTQKGITLIALIITIILMLILAGVVITLTIGKNGIFKVAKYSAQENSEATAREKLELALADLQAHKYTDETYNENEYIDNYLANNNMSVTENRVTVDEWKFTIDRSVPKIGKSLGKGELETIAITTPYVGTASFTIKILYAYKEEEIESYTYKVDGVELKTITEKEYTTQDKLEPESTHIVQAIAKYKNGKIVESNIITIKTEPRMYLYNSGDECVEITNGWIGQSIYGYGTSYGQYNKTDEYLYVKNTSTAAAGSSNYWPAWVTQNQIEISKYKKLVVEGKFNAPNNTTVCILITTNPSNIGAGSYYLNYIYNSNHMVDKIELDLTKDVDLSRLYNIAISCQNSNYNDHSEAKINRVYLQK